MSGKLVFRCPGCKKQLTVDEQYAGKPYVCPDCKTPGTVPARSPQSAPTTPMSTPGPPGPPAMPPAMPPMPNSVTALPGSVTGTKTLPGRMGGGNLRHFLIGLVLAIAVCSVLLVLAQSVPFAEKFTDRGWTPYAAVFLFFWSMSMVTAKFTRVRSRGRALLADYVPADADFSTTAGIERVIAASRTLSQRLKDTILGHRIRRALEHYSATRNVGEVGELLREESQSDFDAMHSSYTLIRLFVWTIPILGFIGTVVGVSDAVGGFANFLSAAQEVDEIKIALTSVTQGLGVAFDTTFVALVLSVILMIAMSSVQKTEQDQLIQFEDYCQNALLRRLPAVAAGETGGGVSGKDLVQTVRDVVKELVPSIEMWRGEADKLAKALTDSLEKAWTQTSGDWFKGVADITRAVESSAGAFAAGCDRVSTEREALAKTAKDMVTQTADVMRATQDSFRRTLEDEQKAITEAVNKQHNMVQRYAGALESTGGKLANVVDLQQKLEQDLIRVSGSAGLAAVIADLRGLLEKLEPAVAKLANEPLNVEVNFVAGAAPAK